MSRDGESESWTAGCQQTIERADLQDAPGLGNCGSEPESDDSAADPAGGHG